MKRGNKKGQLKISFGMIFSIILVIVFLVFGFYAIQKFLSLQDDLVMKKFQENFERDLDKVWASSQASKRVEYTVSKDVEQVCVFEDKRGLDNVDVYIKGIPTSVNFEKIDVDKSLVSGKPMCVQAENSKVSFLLSKKYGENLVTVKP